MATSFAAVVQTPGTCFVCGCTEGDPCLNGFMTGQPCSWVDAQQSVCSQCLNTLGSVAIEYLLNEVCGSRAEQQQAEPSRIVLP